jgi:ankyrin repeat protein
MAGRLDEVRAILEGDPEAAHLLQGSSFEFEPPLCKAARCGWLDGNLARLLLEHGADPDAVDVHGLSALGYLLEATYEENTLVKQGLWRPHCLTSRQQPSGKAITWQRPQDTAEAALCLVGAGANLFQPNPVGKTPLALASKSGRDALAQALLRKAVVPGLVALVGPAQKRMRRRRKVVENLTGTEALGVDVLLKVLSFLTSQGVVETVDARRELF